MGKCDDVIAEINAASFYPGWRARRASSIGDNSYLVLLVSATGVSKQVEYHKPVQAAPLPMFHRERDNDT